MRISALVVVLAILPLSPVLATAQSDDVGALIDEVGSLSGQGRYEEAIPIAERVLEEAKSALSSENPILDQLAEWLGGLYHNAKRYRDAEPHLKQALETQEALLGLDHPDLLGLLTLK